MDSRRGGQGCPAPIAAGVCGLGLGLALITSRPVPPSPSPPSPSSSLPCVFAHTVSATPPTQLRCHQGEGHFHSTLALPPHSSYSLQPPPSTAKQLPSRTFLRSDLHARSQGRSSRPSPARGSVVTASSSSSQR